MFWTAPAERKVMMFRLPHSRPAITLQLVSRGIKGTLLAHVSYIRGTAAA